MANSTVKDTIKDNIENHQTRFVLPTRYVRDQWLLKLHEFFDVTAVARNRFLTWDEFKSEVMSVDEGGKKRDAVNPYLRKLFAESIARTNAEKPESDALFTELIPINQRERGNAFAPGIAQILPQLNRLCKIMHLCEGVTDALINDYKVLYAKYQQFLNKNNLAEPSWNEGKYTDTTHHYYLFYPELIDDYQQFPKLPEEFVTELSNDVVSTGSTTFSYFSNYREEINSCVKEIFALTHNNDDSKNLAYEDIAISLTSLDAIQPYLTRELALYDIPYRLRSGVSLSSYGAGRLFNLINDCSVTSYSLDSMKALFLDEHIPWAHIELNRALINCGIKNNIICPLDGKNSWKLFFEANPGNTLKSYYENIDKHILYLTSAKSFESLRSAWFSFRKALLLPETIDELSDEKESEADSIISRCIEELINLISLEHKYIEKDEKLKPVSCWKFFLQALNDKFYVKKPENHGVNIYPFPVAAGAPFKKHFYLNMTQKEASTMRRDMSFLRSDIRKNLGLAEKDTDQSSAVFLSASSFDVVFSASQNSVNGYAIPHNHFACYDVNANAGNNGLYLRERNFWKGESKKEEDKYQGKILEAQSKSYDEWSKRRNAKDEKQFDMMQNSFPDDLPTFRDFSKQAETALPVSATGGLNIYGECSMKWFLQSRHLLNLHSKNLEAEAFSPALRGSFYHAVLRAFFARVKKEEDAGTFHKEHMDTYKRWIDEEVLSAIPGFITKDEAPDVIESFDAHDEDGIDNEMLSEYKPILHGPLAKSLLESASKPITAKLVKFIDTLKDNFDKFTPILLEEELHIKENNLDINGTLDNVMKSTTLGQTVIFDYKSSDYGISPAKSGKRKYTTDKKTKEKVLSDTPPVVEDFQIPLYIKLYEANHKMENKADEVNAASFLIISKAAKKQVLGDGPREDYNASIQLCDDMIAAFTKAARELDFHSKCASDTECFKCDYMSVCRKVYHVK